MKGHGSQLPLQIGFYLNGRRMVGVTFRLLNGHWLLTTAIKWNQSVLILITSAKVIVDILCIAHNNFVSMETQKLH